MYTTQKGSGTKHAHLLSQKRPGTRHVHTLYMDRMMVMTKKSAIFAIFCVFREKRDYII